MKSLSENEQKEFLSVLKVRFEKNKQRHTAINWSDVEDKLKANPDKLSNLLKMETTDGEPDVVAYDQTKNEFLFFDCVAESPKSRRSYCYDKEALDKRKENKPKNSAVEAAKSIGIELLDESDYRFLQTLGTFDAKTSSWLQTPENIRKLGGAIFGDFRFDTVFVYHNGAESYYAARGFRGKLSV
ncbi:DUF4256 domain-containing protein [Flavobacterium agrisoli]|uniref:DUF4256 domain-containing protein n=1 Tax=Flavobacterium agrisoli TaxID=2793066 RepID=A0A934PJG0_9FLAO|nr:DUF4256 domain-containing protein [Flavobacterium agrisoli]MBK0369252.1 DUF4256 domain-containing protein [Flavobacterium agrisoli]